MANYKHDIELFLEKNMLSDIDSKPKEEIIQSLSIYHEELRFQNDELRRINTELEYSKMEYEQLFMESPVGYLLLDDEFYIIKSNAEAIKLLNDNFLLKKKPSSYIRDEDQDELYHMLRKAVHYKKTFSADLYTREAIDQRCLRFIANPHNNTLHIAIMDVTQENKRNKEIEYLSFHDQLTGLYNRRFFEAELKRLKVEGMFPLGLVMADINGLKLINDAFGHSSGDNLLIEAAKRLKKYLGQEDILARLGGDEFVFLFPQADEDTVKKIVEKTYYFCKDLVVNDITLSISFGYSVMKETDQNAFNALRVAEDRMYKNKLYNKTSFRKELINGILNTLHEKHPREEAHSRRVSELAVSLARAMKMDEYEVNTIKTAGLLHDIGKISVDSSILDKPGKLTEEEFDSVKKHSEVGYRLLKETLEFKDIADIVLSHHERPDGRGYPLGVSCKKILIESKIIAICDAYDAMTGERPYKKMMKKQEAVEEIRKHSGTQFDCKIANIFIEEVLQK